MFQVDVDESHFIDVLRSEHVGYRRLATAYALKCKKNVTQMEPLPSVRQADMPTFANSH